MSMNINNNDQLIISQLGQGVTWQPSEGQTVDGSNYGEILSVSTTDDGNYVVTTDKGTLTFSADSPELDEAQEVFADYELGETGFEEFNGFNWLEIAALVLEAENLRRKSAREVRLAARDTAFSQNMAAADDIRNGAIANLVCGCISGGLSIAGGAFSLKGALGSIKNARLSTQDMKLAKTENSMAKSQAELSNVKADIAATKAKIDDPDFPGDKAQLETDLKAMEAKKTQLELDVEQQRTELKQDLEKTDAKLKETEKELNESNQKLTELDEQIANTDNPVKKAKLQLERKWEQSTRDNLMAKREILTARKEGLTEIQAKSDEFVDDVDGAKAAEADEWATNANERYSAAETKVAQDYQRVQAELQVSQAWGDILKGVGQLVSTLGGFLDSEFQAASKVHEAEAQQSIYAQDDANADWQNAQEAIRNFKEAWAKFLDTIKATQDRLVQA